MGSYPTKSKVMDETGLLMMYFLYKINKFKLYNEWHKNNPMYVAEIRDTRGDFGDFSVLRK